MENNYVLVYEVNAERVLFVPQSVFVMCFEVDLSDNSCYYHADSRTFEHELRDKWYEFSKKYKSLPKNKRRNNKKNTKSFSATKSVLLTGKFILANNFMFFLFYI